jgi:hypothetical protein
MSVGQMAPRSLCFAPRSSQAVSSVVARLFSTRRGRAGWRLRLRARHRTGDDSPSKVRLSHPMQGAGRRRRCAPTEARRALCPACRHNLVYYAELTLRALRKSWQGGCGPLRIKGLEVVHDLADDEVWWYLFGWR